MGDVMISLHVASMRDSAISLKKYLQSKGLSVWICVDSILGGDNYRTEIIKTLKACSVIIPLINNEWALSGECQDEYAFAKRLNLTSHESGRTKREEARKPIFIPIAFPNLVWNAHPQVELLAASTNFIIHNDDTLLQGNSQQTLNTVALSLNNVGYNIQLDGIDPKSIVANTTINKSAPGPRDVKQQVLEAAMLAQALTTSLQQVSSMVADNNKSKHSVTTSDGKIEHKCEEKLIKGARYLGTSSSTGETANIKWANWDSYEFLITDYNESTCEFKATFTSTELRKELINPPPKIPKFISDWVSDLGEAIFNCSGTFNAKTQLLQFKSDSVNIIKKAGSEWSLRKYYFVLFNGLLIGSAFLDTQKNVPTYVLQQF